MQTNSCYFTCSIYYLNASPAAMSRYREISGPAFPAFSPRISREIFGAVSFSEAPFLPGDRELAKFTAK